METQKLNFAKIAGISIGLIAIVMLIIDLIYPTINFNTTVLVLVICIAAVLLTQKSKPVREEISLNSKQRLIVLSITSLVIVAGIIAFIFTF